MISFLAWSRQDMCDYLVPHCGTCKKVRKNVRFTAFPLITGYCSVEKCDFCASGRVKVMPYPIILSYIVIQIVIQCVTYAILVVLF